MGWTESLVYRGARARQRVVTMTITPARPVVRTPPPSSPRPSPAAAGRTLLPGLAATGAAVVVAWFVNRTVPEIAPLTAAVVLGVIVGNLRILPASTKPGLAFSAKRVMRLAIALLGVKLALSQVLGLGWQTLVVVLVVVGATFFGTQWLGRRMGLPGDQPLLIATGFSICGASAVAAMNGVTDSEEEDVVTAVALVTLCGSLAIAVLPLLHHPLGLDPLQFGRWAGASVHDVGQVVAVAQTAGPLALTQAVVVKLMRVALLAPLVTGVALARRRRQGAAAVGGRRPAPVPLFLVGFLGCVALRSTDVVSASLAAGIGTVDDLLMAAALFALGMTVDIRSLVRTGRKALLLGLASWVTIAGVSLAGVWLTT